MRTRTGQRRQRPRVRHDGRPAHGQAPATRTTGARTTSARPAAGRSSWPIRRSYLTEQELDRRAGPGRHDLHLPHASRRSGRSGPGACPICGMALEPELVDGGRGAQSRTRRHVAAVLDRAWRLTLPVFVLEMGGPPRTTCIGWLGQQTSNWIATSCWRRPWCCGPGGRSSSAAGLPSSTRNLNMFTLIAMGTGVAWVYSIVGHLLPGVFPGADARP